MIEKIVLKIEEEKDDVKRITLSWNEAKELYDQLCQVFGRPYTVVPSVPEIWYPVYPTYPITTEPYVITCSSNG